MVGSGRGINAGWIVLEQRGRYCLPSPSASHNASSEPSPSPRPIVRVEAVPLHYQKGTEYRYLDKRSIGLAAQITTTSVGLNPTRSGR